MSTPTKSNSPTKTKKQKLLESIEEAKKKLKHLEESERLHFATLADKAGLLDIEYSDDEMIKALKEVAGRFRGKGK